MDIEASMTISSVTVRDVSGNTIRLSELRLFMPMYKDLVVRLGRNA